MSVSVPGMLSTFFSDFRRFAGNLDGDCARLRAQLDGAATPSPGSSLSQTVNEMHAEAAELQTCIGSMVGAPENTASLEAFLDAATRLTAANKQRLKAVELELEQYGFVRPPVTDEVADAAAATPGTADSGVGATSDEAAPASAEDAEVAAGETLHDAAEHGGLNSTFTMETTEAEAAGQEEAAEEAAATLEVAEAPGNSAEAGEAVQTAGATVAATPARPPAVVLEESTPKTPSLEDFGLSTAALAMLQGNKSARKVQPIVAPTPLRTAVTPEQSTCAKTPAGYRPSAHLAVDEASPSDSSFDVTSYGITSVALLHAGDGITPQRQDSLSACASATPDFVAPISAALSHGILSEMPSTPAEMAPSPVLADPVLAASAVTAAAAAVGLESSFAAAPAAEPAIDGRQVLKAVAEAEYAELPSYLQTQIDLGFLNEVLEALYDCVSTSGMDPQDVVLSTSQLRDDLGLGEKARVVLLTLIKLKRMKAAGLNEEGDKIYVFL